MTNNALRNKEILTNLMAARERNTNEIKKQKIATEGQITAGITKEAVRALGNAGTAALGSFLGSVNSPEWYKNWPDIGKNIGKGNVPEYVVNDVVYPDGIHMPSVVTFFYEDTYGPTVSPEGFAYTPVLLPINEAALRYQTDLYSYNSVLNTVQPADVMQYTIGATDIVVLFCQTARALKAYKTFSADTNELNKKLVDACGWDSSDMETNYKNIVNWLNTAIESFNRDLVIPAGMSYIHRKIFLASGCWGEDYGKNSAIYVTRPMSFRRWSETSGRLTAYHYPQKLTFASVVNTHNLMKQQLIGSSDIVAMVRNIKSGERNGLEILQVPLFEEGDLPIYPVDEVLEQIMNSNPAPLIGATYAISSNISLSDLYDRFEPRLYHLNQDASGYLVPTHNANGTVMEDYTPHTFTGGTASAETNESFIGMMNFLHDEVSVDDLLVATRLKPIWKRNNSGASPNVHSTYTQNAGTEVLIGIGMNFNSGGSSVSYRVTSGWCQNDIATPLEMFAPLRATPVVANISGSGLGSVNKLVQDWHSMVEISEKTLNQLTRCAVLSEFYIGDKKSFDAASAAQGSASSTNSGRKPRNHHRRSGKKPEGGDKDKK